MFVTMVTKQKKLFLHRKDNGFVKRESFYYDQDVSDIIERSREVLGFTDVLLTAHIGDGPALDLQQKVADIWEHGIMIQSNKSFQLKSDHSRKIIAKHLFTSVSLKNVKLFVEFFV